jgi:probable phosphoglycerate mutase
MAPKSYPQRPYLAPAEATELLLVRHGASAPYVEGEVFPVNEHGQGDPPLAPEGRDQAELVGKRLAGERIDAIYVTSLCRTVETAAPLVAATGIEPVVEPDLREVQLGDWDGGIFRVKLQEAHDGGHVDPEMTEFMRTGDWGVMPGAESNADLIARCSAAVARIHAAHPAQNVVAFVHGGVINALLSHALGSGSSMQFGGAANTSVNHLVLLGDTRAIRSFNDTAHLGPCFSPRSADR